MKSTPFGMARKDADVLPTFRFTDLTPLTDPYDRYQFYSPDVYFSSNTPRTRQPDSFYLGPATPFISSTREQQLSGGIPLLPKWRQYFSCWILLLLTTLWLLLTIVLSFLSSSSYPPSFLVKPEWTVLVLNLSSHVAVFLLAELNLGTCEMLRWAMSSRPSGVEFATFLGLSRGTGNLGVLSLLFSRQNAPHRKWCIQRLFHVLIGVVIGIALLARISVVTSYTPSSFPQNIISGLGPFNPEILDSLDRNLTSALFSSYTLGFFADRTSVVSQPPSSCMSSACFSYILTGGLYKTVPNPSNISETELNGGTVYVVENAPGYQLDFTYGPDDLFQWPDCGIYPVATTAIAFCLKNVDDYLFADNMAAIDRCKTPSGSWRSHRNVTIQLRASSMRLTTVYSLQNSSILSTGIKGAMTSIDIPRQKIFAVLDNRWNLTYPNPVQAQMLLMLAHLLNQGNVDGRGAWTDSDLLRSFLAFMLHLLSDPLPAGLDVHGYVAREGYRIIISKYSQYLFTVLCFSSATWSAAVLVYCYKVGLGPNNSLFPEVDFAAKVVKQNNGVQELLGGLGNATTSEVKKRMRGKIVYVGGSSEGEPRVVIATESRLGRLTSGRLYL